MAGSQGIEGGVKERVGIGKEVFFSWRIPCIFSKSYK
jgi:hypothetical protein